MKEQALWLYRRYTARSRANLLASLRNEGNVPISVLFYHRVADKHPNDWTINCRNFAAHLDWLQENFDVVSLREAQRRIRNPTCTRPTVAITFDDGYHDNSDFAIPELASRNLPATYFVTTDFCRTGGSFPHDLKNGVALAPNTLDDLLAYEDMGIEIGAHTRRHADIGQLQSESEVRDEIIGSLEDLRDWLGHDIDYFAFPYGLPANMSQLAVDLLTDYGVKGFCSAYGAWNWPGSGGTHIRRIHADPGIERLRNWLTLDSRKLVDPHQLPFDESALNPPPTICEAELT